MQFPIMPSTFSHSLVHFIFGPSMRHENIIFSRNGPQTTKESLARPRHSSACSALSEEEQAKPRKRNTLSPKCEDMSLQPYQYKRYKIFVLQHMGHPSYGNSMIEGSFEGKLPTIIIDGKAEAVRVKEEKQVRRKKINEKDRTSREAARHFVFSNVLWLGGPKRSEK